MKNKEAIQIINDALNLANSKGAFGQLQNSAIISTAFSTILSNFKDEVAELNKEFSEKNTKEIPKELKEEK